MLSFAWTVAASADDFEHTCLDYWHQWRGPNADGVAPHADPPLHWDDSTNIQWKSDIPGSGSATPIVWDDRVFVLTALDTGQQPSTLPTIDTDMAGAAEEDSLRLRGGKRRGAKPPLTTPRPNTLFRFDVLCLDRATGRVCWRHTATEQVPHESHHRSHGYASASPTTDGVRLYVSF